MSKMILNKSTYKILIHRFYKMLNQKGCIKEWSEYTGARSRYNTLAPTSKRKGLLPVVRTCNNYILPNKITRQWSLSRDMEGIVMNITGGTFFYIPFGVKIDICSQYIKFKTVLYSRTKEMGMTTFMIPSGDIKKAKFNIQQSEEFERDYYDSLMEEDLHIFD